MSLPTNYQDDILNVEQNTHRVYNIVDANGNIVAANVHLVDQTVYTQHGTDFAAQDVNAITSKVNSLDTDVTAIKGATYVNKFNNRTGDVSLSSTDVTDALGFTPPQQDTTYQAEKGVVLSSGKFKADLKSETLSTLEAASRGSTANREYPVGLDKNGNLSVNVPWVDTSTEITRTASGTNVPGANVEASLLAINKVNTFNVPISAWVATTDYDYAWKAVILTSEYSADSVPVWQMIGANSVTTQSEQDECNQVMQAYFTASDVTLYAIEKPAVALRLLVKGV